MSHLQAVPPRPDPANTARALNTAMGLQKVYPSHARRLAADARTVGLPTEQIEAFEEKFGVLPEIQVNAREPLDVTRDALAALYAVNEKDPQLFRRGTDICRVRQDDKERPTIGPVGAVELSHHLMRAARFYRVSESRGFAQVPSYPPDPLVRDILGAPTWEFPPLEAVCETPVLRPDGSIVVEPGYDRATGLYYKPEPGLVVPAIPARPTPADVLASLALIDEAIGEFPFADPASKANAIALLITPVVRPMITGPAPLALIDKPAAGTGATLFASVLCSIVAGSTQRDINHSEHDEEMRKAITTALIAGATVVVLDNVSGPIRSSALARVLTTSVWHDRLLGSNDPSAALRVANRATWLATANNAKLRGDIARRTYWIRLDAKIARPWRGREFRHADLAAWASQNRGALLGAVLTLARAWVANGKKLDRGGRMGGFDSWARTIGGILAFAGVRGFLDNLDALYAEADEEDSQWEEFLDALAPELPYPKSALAIAQLIDSSDELKEKLPPQLAEKAGSKAGTFATEIGKQFAAREGKRFDDRGLRLEREWSKNKKSNLWRIVRDETRVL